MKLQYTWRWILKINVSYDEGWHKRGHSSHPGIGAVIDFLKVLPTDFEELSNFPLKSAIPKSDRNCKYWEENHLKKLHEKLC